MDNLLIDTVIDKMDGQNKRLDQNEKTLLEMEEKVSGISDQSDNFKKLAGLVGQVQDRMNGIVWPVEKMNELSLRLKLNNDLLSNPVKTKQTVIHTAGKLAWVITLLFLIVVSLVLGLFHTTDKLEQYKMNDLLWRYVKVTNNGQNLLYLQSVEKLYLKDPEKMKSQVNEEELNKKQQAETKYANPVQKQIDTVPSTYRAGGKIKHRK